MPAVSRLNWRKNPSPFVHSAIFQTRPRFLYKELCRNKLCKDGVGFFACSEAENRRNTLCISRFDNEATGEKGKPDCTDYFVTVPYFGTVPKVDHINNKAPSEL